MTTPVFAQKSIFQQTVSWLVKVTESALDWLFSLSHAAGVYRNTIRTAALLLFYIFSVSSLYSAEGWGEVFARFFAATNANPNQSITQFGLLLYETLLNPLVLRNLIAVIAPYMLVHHFAAIYLADIFEKDVKIANRFLDSAAFATDYLAIRISGGRLDDKHRNSPIVEIGGPGFVTVDMDSVLVLEKPDGGIRVIGPTAKHPKGRAVIEDFERIRQTVDLRDILNGQDITARSKDGIVVKVHDIQYSYSAYRGASPRKTLECPYPFEEKAIEAMVKGVVMPVDPKKQPDRTPEWTRPLPGGLFVNINIEFNNFISQRKLVEFFSAVGPPEEQALQERAQKIHESSSQLAGQDGYEIKASPFKASNVEYRLSLAEKIFGSPQFKNFMANSKGMQVNWIGIGTWETPSEIALKNHVKAWEMSLQNQKDGNPEKLSELYNNSRNGKLIQLINELPVNTFYRLAEKSETEIITGLFDEYMKYLSSINQYYTDQGKKLPGNIRQALESLKLIREHYDISAHYYCCVRTSSKDDTNIAGAVGYSVEVAFSTLHLPGYKAFPVLFDFEEKTQISLTFLAQVPGNTTLTPGPVQIFTMNREDLYTPATFQITVPPNGNNLMNIEIREGQKSLYAFDLELKP